MSIYPPEFRVFSYKLHQRGVRIHILARAIGCSSRTVWNWIRVYRNMQKLTRKGWSRRGLVKIARRGGLVKSAFRRLLRWIYWRDKGGVLDLEACLKGDEPP